MFEKSFITDCEGPLTLNDNAFELCAHFIDDGDKLFKILSLYDDYLVDIVKKEGYKAGNTLKLILPFFVLEKLTNDDLIDFSQNNIYAVDESKFLLKYLKGAMNTYIVSTSYGQYIEALCNYIDFPFQNTYHTQLDVDGATNFNQSDKNSNDVSSSTNNSQTIVGTKSPKFIEELKKVDEFRKIILEHDGECEDDFNVLYDIFFNEFPKLEINKSTFDTYNEYLHSPAKYHKVRKGDTLGKIARRYRTSVKRLCALNRIRPNTKLKIGRRLRVK
jgi:energy-converting hydrogenase A subunit R